MALFEELQSLMVKYRFRPEKKLSQYFCINEALLRFLAIKAELKSTDVVIELGAGTGFLTKFLLEKCKVIAIEKDEVMIALLQEKFKQEIIDGKLELIKGDFLEQDIDKLGANKIVSLPPYHISSEIVAKTILSNIKQAIFVFDTGFIEKIIAFEGFKEYSALTVFLNVNAKVEVLEKIEKSSFFPNPNCVSTVIKMNFDRQNNSKEFYAFLKEIFRHKNKDFSRALKQSRNYLEKQIKINKKIVDEMNFTEKVYAIPPEEFLDIFEDMTSK